MPTTPPTAGVDAALQSSEQARIAAEPRPDRLWFLAEVSRCLADSLDYETTLTTVAGMALPYLDAWCIVDVVEGFNGGHIRRLAVLHPDPRKQAAARELHRRYPPKADDFIGAPRVIRTGRPEIVFEVTDEALVSQARDAEHLSLLRLLGAQAYVIAPMVARGQVLGAITFVTGEAGRRFGDIDLLLTEDLARRAAMALDNARLYGDAIAARDAAEKTLAEAEALTAELKTARDRADEAKLEVVVRAARLQTFAAALSVSSTQGEVADAVVTHAVEVFAAADAVIARLTVDGEHLEIMSANTMAADVRETWARFPTSARVPLADVARTGQPLFLQTREDWAQRYPAMVALLDVTGHHANVVVPLIAEGQVLGVLGVAFDAPRTFDEDARALALSVAQQCAQALERARLFEAERSARAEAEAANRTKGEFLAAMSHELRTPLNAIGGYAQLLEMGLHGPLSEPQREMLSRIDLAQRHLLRLVNDVLNFERLRNGRLEYDVRAVPLADVVAGVESLIRPQLQAKALHYAVDVPAACAVMADRDRLVQVLLNLLSNAVKFTPAGGRVTIDCAERKDGSGDPAIVFLRVADTGIGIPREKTDAVFEAFVQLDVSPTGRMGGAGLGLAISRDLARGMGGELRGRSTVGVGTAFTIALPRAPDTSA